MPTVQELPFTAFSRLSSLSVSRYSYPPNDTFFLALREMHHLTELSFESEDWRDHRVLAECLSVLTGLKSLELSGNVYSIASAEITERHLMTLTQLTQLSLKGYPLFRFRRFPTVVKSLGFRSCTSPPADFTRILMSMTNLTSLSIYRFPEDLRLFRINGVTPSQFSQKLGKLQHLSMRCVLADDAFLDALGMLTQLTSLTLGSRNNPLDPYMVCPRLANLTELMELTISPSVPTPVRNGEFPLLCLPKLRKLDLPVRCTNANMCQALLETLPCLRQMSLSGKTLIF